MTSRALVSVVVVGIAIASIAGFWLKRKNGESEARNTDSLVGESAASNADDGVNQLKLGKLLSTPSLDSQTSKMRKISATDREILERFYTARVCHFNRTDIEGYQSVILECEAMAGIKELANDYAQCSALKPGRENALKELQEKMRSNDCGADPAKLSRSYYDAARAAARAGDASAQICYLESAFGVAYTPKDQREYVRAAPTYIKEGFRRGDWRVALLLSRDTYPTGLLSQIVKTDPLSIYKLNRLLHKGASGVYAATLDVQARTLTTPAESPDIPYVDSQAAASADRWADDMYRKYFTSSPPVDEKILLCAI